MLQTPANLPAVCHASRVGDHVDCVVTLTNQKNEDEEFMAGHRVERDRAEA
jgi:hypothetical protein